MSSAYVLLSNWWQEYTPESNSQWKQAKIIPLPSVKLPVRVMTTNTLPSGSKSTWKSKGNIRILFFKAGFYMINPANIWECIYSHALPYFYKNMKHPWLKLFSTSRKKNQVPYFFWSPECWTISALLEEIKIQGEKRKKRSNVKCTRICTWLIGELYAYFPRYFLSHWSCVGLSKYHQWWRKLWFLT